ncbi:MAG: ClpP family protease [Oscillospiraceae bacterium]
MAETEQTGLTGENDREEKEGTSMDQRQQQIVDMGSTTITTKRGTIHTLTIVGQVEGHQILPPNTKSTKYEHVMPLLATIEESEDIDGLLILLNTMGGDIEAGLGIAELIASMSKPTVSLVLGGGHSIGVPLAVSAKASFIAPSAAMTIHPVRMSGLIIGVAQTFNYFQRIQERIIQFVTHNSNVKREVFTKMMLQTEELASDVGSVIYGEEAVRVGLIDRIGGLSDALECLHGMMEERRRQAEDHQKN